MSRDRVSTPTQSPKDLGRLGSACVVEEENLKYRTTRLSVRKWVRKTFVCDSPEAHSP